MRVVGVAEWLTVFSGSLCYPTEVPDRSLTRLVLPRPPALGLLLAAPCLGWARSRPSGTPHCCWPGSRCFLPGVGFHWGPRGPQPRLPLSSPFRPSPTRPHSPTELSPSRDVSSPLRAASGLPAQLCAWAVPTGRRARTALACCSCSRILSLLGS